MFESPAYWLGCFQGLYDYVSGFRMSVDCIRVFARLLVVFTSQFKAQLNREKRKYLVNGIQDALNKNDKLIHRLDDYRYKCEHPEEGL